MEVGVQKSMDVSSVAASSGPRAERDTELFSELDLGLSDEEETDGPSRGLGGLSHTVYVDLPHLKNTLDAALQQQDMLEWYKDCVFAEYVPLTHRYTLLLGITSLPRDGMREYVTTAIADAQGIGNHSLDTPEAQAQTARDTFETIAYIGGSGIYIEENFRTFRTTV
ncbi:hypothetical protein LTR15_005885 [Elasticomyces elasticus]|nr:hypothetical protein LTR15_005885 [Elasticomyces elasticus]